MKRSEKKGFTIVELVIVIAVIAILAAVLIPNLSKLVTNANETADTMLIKELNTALDLDLERHETMYDALVAVERAGFIVSRINASVAGNEILWDSVNDCFVYLKGNEIVYQANREETPVDRSKKYLYWRIYESLPTEQTYSIYLNNETYNAETSVTVGFDAGRNKNAFAVNYTGTGTAQKVILRTDGQNLTVDAGKDTVNHYGAIRTLTVTAVATSDCYHEHGFVGTLASFESGKLVAYRGAQYHQTKDDIVAKLDGKTFDLDKAIFGQHYYDAQGICIVSGCGKTSDSHVHNFVDGTCACGAKEGTTSDEPTEVRIQGVVSYQLLDDHKDKEGNVIGNQDLLDSYGVTAQGGQYMQYFFHTMTITYTIPKGTSANAKIILEQPSEVGSRIVDLAAPMQSFGITYKIVNESGNDYGSIKAMLESKLVENITNANSIVQLQDDKWICLLNDGTYAELPENARPIITEDGPFNEYRAWLMSNGKTTYSSVSANFIEEYYSTHSKTIGSRFVDYVKTLPETSDDVSTTTQANVYEKMCSNWAGNTTEYRHVEGDVIRQMIAYQQEKLIGYAFVENKYDSSASSNATDGWMAVYRKAKESGNINSWNYQPFVEWNKLAPTELNVTSCVDLFENGAEMVYTEKENVITAGVAMIWHGFAGNAWQNTVICDFPAITIILEK